MLKLRHPNDYTFAPFKSQVDYGDSGPLLLATSKQNKNLCYVVKHSFADCAANEFVYTCLAKAMDLKMPNVVLFQLPSNKGHFPFQTKYIMGSELLPIKIEDPTYQQILDLSSNWQDYFRFHAMFIMMGEADSFETPIASDGCLYRIDTAASFSLDTHIMSAADYPQFQSFIQEYIDQLNYNQPWQERGFQWYLQVCTERYGTLCQKPFLETFMRLCDITEEYIDSFLHTLCLVYPTMIGDYYKRYISGLQKQSHLFVNENVQKL